MDPAQIVNDILGLDLAQTNRADEYKGWKRDSDGGSYKFYLDHDACRLLSIAFLEMSKKLEKEQG